MLSSFSSSFRPATKVAPLGAPSSETPAGTVSSGYRRGWHEYAFVVVEHEGVELLVAKQVIDPALRGFDHRLDLRFVEFGHFVRVFKEVLAIFRPPARVFLVEGDQIGKAFHRRLVGLQIAVEIVFEVLG